MIICGTVLSAGYAARPSWATSDAESSHQLVQQEPTLRQPVVLALLGQAWVAMGGHAEAAAEPSSLAGTFSIFHSSSEAATLSIVLDTAGNSIETVTDSNGLEDTVASSSNLFSMKHTRGTSTTDMPPHKALNQPSYLISALLKQILTDPAWSAYSNGTTTINGRACGDIIVRREFPLSTDSQQSFARFSEKHLYIDVATDQLLRVTYQSYSNTNVNSTYERQLDYLGYTHFGQWYFPSVIEDRMNGQLLNRILVTAVN